MTHQAASDDGITLKIVLDHMQGMKGELKGDIKELKGDIKELKEDIKELKEDIRQLNEKVDRMDRKFTTQISNMDETLNAIEIMLVEEKLPQRVTALEAKVGV